MSIDASPLETLATGYGLVEGPRVDADGRLYFSDAQNGGVYCRTPDGKIETVIPKRGGVGGIALHADGGIVVSGRNLCHVKDGVTRVVFAPEDTPGFNDLITDSHGRVLVGSQRFNPFAKKVEFTPGELYRVESEGKATMLYDDVILSNGLALSPDERLLYHNDSVRNQILLHDVLDDGSCANRRLFASMPEGYPDGLAVDELGCVWAAVSGGGCVARYTPEGKLDGQLPIPAKGVVSLCFAGDDRRDLYVVTRDNVEDPDLGGCIYRTRVAVAGLAVPPAQI